MAATGPTCLWEDPAPRQPRGRGVPPAPRAHSPAWSVPCWLHLPPMLQGPGPPCTSGPGLLQLCPQQALGGRWEGTAHLLLPPHAQIPGWRQPRGLWVSGARRAVGRDRQGHFWGAGVGSGEAGGPRPGLSRWLGGTASRQCRRDAGAKSEVWASEGSHAQQRELTARAKARGQHSGGGPGPGLGDGPGAPGGRAAGWLGAVWRLHRRRPR